jgi:UDP:flavonoid glycosyltransferase YjiC (YdhE family)
MRVLIATWFGGGNVRPVLATALDLVQRGHQVTVLTNPALRAKAQATGASFLEFGRVPAHDPRSLETDIVAAHEGRTIDETNQLVAKRLVFGIAEQICHDTLEAIDSVDPDAVIADYVLPGALTAARAKKRTCLVVADGMYPLPYPERPRESSVYAYLFERMTSKWLPHLNALRRSVDCPAILSPADLYADASAFLVMTYPMMSKYPPPPRTYFAGPQFVPPSSSDAVAGERHIMLGSFSTIVTPEQSFVIANLAEALAQMGLESLIAAGSSRLASNHVQSDCVRIAPFVSLEDLLPRSRLHINHAGNGTIVRTLAHGVPQICVPLIQDQHEYAQRLEELGVAVRLRKTASACEYSAAISQALDDDGLADRAMEIARCIRDQHEPARAARLVEDLV